MNEYYYCGPVKAFGDYISNQWRASTFAVSEAKAKSNFMYQYKMEHNLPRTAKVELVGKIHLVSK